MLAKVRDKRIKAFKNSFPNHTISKKGNFVFEKNKIKREVSINYHGLNVTKNTVHKIGTTESFEKSHCDAVYVITQTGKLLVKTHTKYFKNCTVKDVIENEDLIDVFFIGRKYDYLKNYPNLWSFRYFQNFNSLKDAKKHISCGFISDEEFYNLFENITVKGWGRTSIFDTLSVLLIAKDKAKAYNLLNNSDKKTKDTLLDYLNMCKDEGITPKIPAGKHRLNSLHDELVLKINEKNADRYSKKTVYKTVGISEDKELFEKEWKKRGIVFKRLNSPYEMYLQGLRQKHCIGSSFYNKLNSFSFYSISFEKYSYEIMITPQGNIAQFYGKYDSVPPKTLVEKVGNINYEHKIVKIEGATLEDYPLIENKKPEDDWIF